MSNVGPNSEVNSSDVWLIKSRANFIGALAMVNVMYTVEEIFRPSERLEQRSIVHLFREFWETSLGWRKLPERRFHFVPILFRLRQLWASLLDHS